MQICSSETRYPEFSFFKTLPAYGLYSRHVKKLKIENVSFNVTSEDQREAIYIEDTQKILE